jgi:hypothetical protein
MTQEMTRSSADDVPRAQAQRAADTLSRGGAPAQVAPAAATDLATDVGPFMTLYGANGAVQGHHSPARRRPPEVPRAVLAQAKAHGIDRVTWQSRAGVREAVIALPWRSTTAQAVVVAGASLRPSEDRQAQLLLLLLAGWLAATIGSLAMTGVAVRWLGSGRPGRRSRRPSGSPATGTTRERNVEPPHPADRRCSALHPAAVPGPLGLAQLDLADLAGRGLG